MVSGNLALLALAAASVFNSAFAKPVHRRHQNMHVERANKLERVEVQVIVWVDQHGNTISQSVTTRIRQETAAPVYEPVPAPSPKTTTPAPPPPPPTTLAKVTTPKKTKTKSPRPQSTPGNPKPSTGSNPVNPGTIGKGVTWTPYTTNDGCKTPDVVQAELNAIKAAGYQTIRLYSTACNEVADVVKFAFNNGMTVILGIFDLGNPTPELTKIIDSIAAVAKACDRSTEEIWRCVPLIGVGNEEVFKGRSDIGGGLAKVAMVRNEVQKSGFRGSVANVEIWFHTRDNPALCGVDPIVPINMHTYFDQGCTAGGSGDFIAGKIKEVENVCPGKKVVVVETGWPHHSENPNARGGERGANRENQGKALASIHAKSNELHGYIFLSSFDELWKRKSDRTDQQTEGYWGIL